MARQGAERDARLLSACGGFCGSKPRPDAAQPSGRASGRGAVVLTKGCVHRVTSVDTVCPYRSLRKSGLGPRPGLHNPAAILQTDPSVRTSQTTSRMGGTCGPKPQTATGLAPNHCAHLYNFASRSAKLSAGGLRQREKNGWQAKGSPRGQVCDLLRIRRRDADRHLHRASVA